MEISHNSPAEEWSQGIPLGNGHIGCMLYGGIEKERIDLSEITFFSGEKSNENNQKNAAEKFQKMRQDTSMQEYEKASEAAKDFIGIRQNYGTNLPVGSIMIDFELPYAEIGEYERKLDLMNGIATVSFAANPGINAACITNEDKVTYEDKVTDEEKTKILRRLNYRREAFVSNPAKKLYYRIQAEKNKPINCMISFQSGNSPCHISIVHESYLFQVKAVENIHSDGKCGTSLWGCIKTEQEGGSASYTSEGIVVKGANRIDMTVEMKTDYEVQVKHKPDYEKVGPSSGEDRKHMNKIGWEEEAKQYFSEEGISYDREKKIHIDDFSNYMKRVEFSLKEDEMSEKMFQFGRYLLLSSSRQESPLPAHLQGIWNDNVACNIGWTCDMHLDINTQMNYWLSEAGNLAECHEPLFHWMEQMVIPSGRCTARESYGMPGWSADLVSNPWGYTAPYWSRTISPCPTGGIWTASDYWEHYEYSGDMEFLRKRAYPILLEAVEFFIEYLFIDGDSDYYIAGPSISPENCFLVDEKKYYFSNGCTYEILMIRELFSQFLKASSVLGIINDQVNRVQELLPKLLPYRIKEDGTIAEWNHDYPAADLQHRHTSHLLGVFPYSQISPDKTPQLAQAAKKTILNKLTSYENWEDTGWARSMLILYSARLKDSKSAYFHIKEMQNHLTKKSMFVMHPPTRGAGSFKEVYELDGNTGFSMGIIELLLQSHDNLLQLLPALPEEWSNGSIRGILARGGITVNLEWNNGVLTKAEFITLRNGSCEILYSKKRYTLQLEKEKINIFVPE